MQACNRALDMLLRKLFFILFNALKDLSFLQTNGAAVKKS
jgi:hypothetical protein